MDLSTKLLLSGIAVLIIGSIAGFIIGRIWAPRTKRPTLTADLSKVGEYVKRGKQPWGLWADSPQSDTVEAYAAADVQATQALFTEVPVKRLTGPFPDEDEKSTEAFIRERENQIKKERVTPRYHDYRNPMWGHSASANTDNAGQTIYGHLFNGRMPLVGDYILLKNGPGETRYQLTEVEGVRDPDDMWRYKAKLAPRTKAEYDETQQYIIPPSWGL